MARLARDVLSIPASGAGVERLRVLVIKLGPCRNGQYNSGDMLIVLSVWGFGRGVMNIFSSGSFGSWASWAFLVEGPSYEKPSQENDQEASEYGELSSRYHCITC